MKFALSFLACCALFLAAPLSASAQAPLDRNLNYRGQLDLNGEPFTGAVQVRFRLYTDAFAREGNDCLEDPNCMWEEAHPNVQVFGGRFNAQLGARTDGLAALVRQDRQYYIELAIRPQPEADEEPVGWTRLRNRQKVNPAPQAIWSANPVPPGAVMHFNLAECPPGWRRFVPANGRYIVAMQPGGTLGAQIGAPLADTESRISEVKAHTHGTIEAPHQHDVAALPHNHQVNVDVVDDGHVHSIRTSFGASGDFGAHRHGGGHRRNDNSNRAFTGIRVNVGLEDGHVDIAQQAVTTGLAVQPTGVDEGTNSPYVQLLACERFEP